MPASAPPAQAPTAWLLAGDPAIRWQALRDLLAAPAAAVARERRRISRDGWGARLLAKQDPEGTGARGLYSPKWISTAYTMLLLRDFGLAPSNRQARKACALLVDGGLQRDGGINYGWRGRSETHLETGVSPRPSTSSAEAGARTAGGRCSRPTGARRTSRSKGWGRRAAGIRCGHSGCCSGGIERTALAMTTYIGLLRAVNLGPHNKVAMSDLREIVTGLGMLDVRTVLQSGNVVFRSTVRSTAQLERLLERTVEQHFRLKTDVFVRTPAEWREMVAANPFAEFAARDPSHLLVVFLKEAVSQAALAAFRKAITGPEQVGASGRHMFIVYPDGIGRSRLGTLPEAKVAATGTARNWNTVLKLGAMTARSRDQAVGRGP